MVRRLAMICALALMVGGCASSGGGDGNGANVGAEFTRKVDLIRPGMTRQQVRQALGRPDSKQIRAMQPEPTAAADSAVAGIVPPGARYEQWFYARPTTHYHIFFGSSNVNPGQWVVIKVVANPAGASAGGTDIVPNAR